MVLDEFETHLDLCQFRLIPHLPILLWLAGIERDEEINRWFYHPFLAC